MEIPSTFYFNKNLNYIQFIQNAVGLLYSNTNLSCLCVPVAHIMWHMYESKTNTKSPVISVTVEPKEIASIKAPTCPSYWILHEYTKNIVSCPIYTVKSIEKMSRKALEIIRKTSTLHLPSVFEYALLESADNPVQSFKTLHTYRSSSVILCDDDK